MLEKITNKLRMPDGSINPWVIAITVTLATFMEVLDTSIANVALPHIKGNLSASADEATWVLTSYLVSNAIVLPLSGWLSSLIGRKRFYMSCVIIFTLSSFLCGFAHSLGMLVFFRILQGAGGGGLQPSEQAILNDTFPNVAWRLPSMASPLWLLRPSVHGSADSSPITIRGVGFSTSTCLWESFPLYLRTCLYRIRRT